MREGGEVMNLTVLILLMLLLPMLSGLALYFAEKYRDVRAVNVLAVILAAIECVFCCMLWTHSGEKTTVPLLFAFGLNFQVTGFQLVLVSLASFLWIMTTAFCPYYFHSHGGIGRYQLFSFITWGAMVGVFMSADFVTLLIFFEIMSVASWVMVIHEQTPGAVRAADSYLAFAIIGGLCTMMGLFMLKNLAGTLSFSELAEVVPGIEHNAKFYTAGVFVLIGFATKCGMWPLHTWLPAAHPAAPATASALLSGIITKAGVFGVSAVCVTMFAADYNWGLALLCFAVITMFTGAFLALFSIDLKRTLACSSMSQIGFILVGIAMQRLLGEEKAIAVYGSVLHVVNHSTLKLCLFLCAGVLVHCCHSRDLNDLKGFGRGKPVFFIAFLFGTLGITCMPLFGGYVSKTLLHESILEYIEILKEAGQAWGFFKAVEIVFLISGGFTVAYMTKLFVTLFIDKNDDQAKMDAMNGKYITPIAAVILLLAAVVSPIFGSFPHSSMDRIAKLCVVFFDSHEMEHAVHYFAFANLKGAIISLVIGFTTYFGFIRTLLIRNGRYVDVWPEKLSIENGIYRPLLLKVLPGFFGCVSKLIASIFPTLTKVGPFALTALARFAGSIFDWIVSLSEMLLKRGNENLGANDIDEKFAVYPKEDAERGITATLAYGLALAGVVLVAAFAWVLLRL